MGKQDVSKNLFLIANQLAQSLEEILRAVTLLESLPAPRSERESDTLWKVQEILNRLHVRLARAEVAVSHIRPRLDDGSWSDD